MEDHQGPRSSPQPHKRADLGVSGAVRTVRGPISRFGRFRSSKVSWRDWPIRRTMSVALCKGPSRSRAPVSSSATHASMADPPPSAGGRGSTSKLRTRRAARAPVLRALSLAAQRAAEVLHEEDQVEGVGQSDGLRIPPSPFAEAGWSVRSVELGHAPAVVRDDPDRTSFGHVEDPRRADRDGLPGVAAEPQRLFRRSAFELVEEVVGPQAVRDGYMPGSLSERRRPGHERLELRTTPEERELIERATADSNSCGPHVVPAEILDPKSAGGRVFVRLIAQYRNVLFITVRFRRSQVWW